MVYECCDRKIYYYGDPELEKITDIRSRLGKPQVYGDIVSSLKQSGGNFQDPEFPHTEESVGDALDKLLDTANPNNAKKVEDWRARGWDEKLHFERCSDFVKNGFGKQYKAVFNDGDFGESKARMDIHQGMTGDCWLVSSISAVTLDKSLIDFAVPSENATNDAGVYHFRFWYEGVWVDVVVDDYIPCYIVGKQYITLGSKITRDQKTRIAEFWVPLLEKAYAKLNGGYQQISGNWPIYSLQNLTGGFGQGFKLPGGGTDSDPDLGDVSAHNHSEEAGRADKQADDGGNDDSDLEDDYNWENNDLADGEACDELCSLDETGPQFSSYGKIKKWIGRGLLVCACTSRSAKGIRGPHAYSLTGTAEVKKTDGTNVQLVRFRNPWGHTEWTGPWSDKSDRWKMVSEEQKKACGFLDKDDGEFYMKFEDMFKYFTQLTTCYCFKPDDARNMKEETHFSKWSKADNTAGGSHRIENNPKFPIRLKAVDPDQWFVLVINVTLNVKLKTTVGRGFHISLYKDTDPPAKAYGKGFFKPYNQLIPDGFLELTKVTPSDKKTLTREFHLVNGNYVIVPHTVSSGVEYEFSLRVLSFESNEKLKELNV